MARQRKAQQQQRTSSSTRNDSARFQQRPSPSAPSPGFHTRAMPEIRNPVYKYNQNADFKRTPQPMHALERPPRMPAGVDPRLTVMGDEARAKDLTPIVGMAYQTPYNVWALYPA